LKRRASCPAATRRSARERERIEIEDRFPRAAHDLIDRGHKFQKIGRKGEVRYGYAAAITVDGCAWKLKGERP
jgi:hypothetical protein